MIKMLALTVGVLSSTILPTNTVVSNTNIETTFNVGEKVDYSNVKVTESNDTKTFKEYNEEKANLVSPLSYVITGLPMLGSANEDYSFVYDGDEIDKAIIQRWDNFVVYPINEEKFPFFAVDQDCDEIQLPVHFSFTDANNLLGTGRITVRTRQVHDFDIDGTERIARYKDNRKMKDLTSDIKISNDKTEVEYGKVMFRYGAPGDYYCNWKYVNLEDMLSNNVTLTFEEGVYVQMVVIYEVREIEEVGKDWIWDDKEYYHVRGMYQFRNI